MSEGFLGGGCSVGVVYAAFIKCVEGVKKLDGGKREGDSRSVSRVSPTANPRNTNVNKSILYQFERSYADDIRQYLLSLNTAVCSHNDTHTCGKSSCPLIFFALYL